VKTISSVRQRGGVSRSIDYLRSSLINPDPADEAAKPGAIFNLSELMTVAIDQTANGDPKCGYFLAELLAYLCKRKARLSENNEAFRKCYSKWQSSRVATSRGSPLRPLIHRILAEAHHDRWIGQMTKSIPKAASVLKVNKTLLALPEFRADPKVVSEWTDKIVYPKLQSMRSELKEDPIIGKLDKALDKNRKFQITRLRPLIKQTVARIAALPKAYYFDIW